MFLIAEEDKSLKLEIELDIQDQIKIRAHTIGIYEDVFKLRWLDLVENWGSGLMSTEG